MGIINAIFCTFHKKYPGSLPRMEEIYSERKRIMNENVKKFLEAISKDNSLVTKIKNTTHEELLALAAKLNLPLSKEDIDSNKPEANAISMDELEAVSGGKKCVCAVGGGGEATRKGQHVCACVVAGYGDTDIITGLHCRCVCSWGGGGKDQCYDDY